MTKRVGLVSSDEAALRQVVIPMYGVVYVIANIAAHNQSSELQVLFMGM
jgi:hypothetical protein